MSDRAVAETSTHNIHKIYIYIYILAPAGFEPPVPESERPQTYTLDRKTTGIGFHFC